VRSNSKIGQKVITSMKIRKPEKEKHMVFVGIGSILMVILVAVAVGC